MRTYCGSCLKLRVCKPIGIPELGGLEDWFCARCIRELRATGIEIKIIKTIYG